MEPQEPTKLDFGEPARGVENRAPLRPAVRFTQVCGFLAVSLGSAALLGWLARLPLLSSFSSKWIAMAPSTALLFLLLGSVTFLRASVPRSRSVHRIGRDISLGGMLVALSLFVSSVLGLHWKAEHLGIRIADTLNGIVLGYMSPLTACCFALIALSLLLLPLCMAPRPPWRAMASLGCSSVVTLTSLALLLAYLMGAPALYGSTVIPPAPSTTLAFLALGAGLAVLARAQLHSPEGPPGEAGLRTPYILLLLFVALVVGIITTGYLYYHNHQARYRSEVESQLSAIADLKVNELVQWRRERLGDAAVFADNPVFAEAVHRMLDAPSDPASGTEVKEWMAQVQSAYRYDRVFLVDPSGREWLSVPETREPAATHLLQDVSAALTSGDVRFLDFHRDAPDSPIYLGVVVPLFDPEAEGRPLGALILRIDPETYLYQFIQRWPTPSATAETLLVRRDDDGVVFLNELKFQRGTALTLRRPLTETTLPAAKAALGQEGIVEGIDYRGIPVLAALQSVPDSPWWLVARMDLAEVYAPLRQQLATVILLIGGLLLAAAGGVGLVWRQQNVRYYRDRLQATEKLREIESRFRQTLDTMVEGYQIIGFDYRYLYVNDAVARHGRRAKEDLLGRNMMEAYPGIEATPVFAAIRRCLESRTAEAMENEFTYPDGSSGWFSLSIQPVFQGAIILSLDVTERKRAEEALRALNAELEHRVAERTAQFQASNEELEAFSYSVSHDLRAPLRAIDGFSRLIEEEYADRLDAEGLRLLQVVRDGARKMDQLITDLLTLSRATRTEIRRSRVDMTALAEDCYFEAAPSEVRDGFEFILAPLPEAVGDPGLLRQVWLNLLSNAVKFTARSEVRRIEVTGIPGDEEDTYVVADTGVGFDPDYAGKLFGVFQRLHGPEEFKGTGIGLAIVQRIVHRHGGRVGAEARINRGATFYFTLPRKEGNS